MKKLGIIVVALLILGIFFVSCSQESKEHTTQYKISFQDDYNLAASLPESMTVSEGTILNNSMLPKPEPVDTDNVSFEGWYLYREDKYGLLKPVDGYEVKSYDFYSPEKTLHAKWKYNIVLNGNGGTINGNTVEKFAINQNDLEGTFPTGDSIGIKKDGSTFVCWSTEADGLGDFYAPGEKYNDNLISYSDLKKGTVLYAIWADGTNVKVATEYNLEKTLTSLNAGDRLYIVSRSTSLLPESQKRILQDNLNDSSKNIDLNLSFWRRNGITSIKMDFFNNCTSLNSVIIGRSLKNASTQPVDFYNLFNGCTNLKKAIFRYDAVDKTVSYSEGKYILLDLGRCTNLSDITVGSKIQKISNSSSLNSLNSVKFEDTENWYISSKITYETAKVSSDWQKVDVSNPSSNAKNIRKGGEWENMFFYKN